MIEEYSKSIITMIAVNNPVVSALIFLQITANEPRHSRFKEATNAAIKITVILVIIAFIGKSILNVFGISIESFRIVGGAVIAIIGITMLTGKLQKDAAKASASGGGKVDNTPLLMFSASPGTVAATITLSFNDSGSAVPIGVLIAIGISMLITWVTMLLSSYMPPKTDSGPSYATQFMGLILIAMGMQFMLDGYKVFMMG